MPIYEYRCLRCEQLSEFLLRVSDPQPESCPRCGEAGSLRKQISQTSFSLKGEGWYVTDYKKTASDKTKEGEPEAVTGNPDSKETKPPSVEGGADGPA